MKLPISWMKDFVEVNAPLDELARRLTLAGLEVEEMRFVGLPLSDYGGRGHSETAVTGMGWDQERIVVGEVREVMPHPNADRLVLCRVFDGDQEHTVLTGAPNLFPYLDEGALEQPLKVAYAKEGARLYDGHEPGWEPMTLERTTIRGVESYSMVCSEKELGISEAHEGVIILDDDAEPGTPLADYMGDVVLDIAITPNIARNANVLGVAREAAAILGVDLKEPDYSVEWTGPPIEGRAGIEIQEPELNPRFVLGLIEDVDIKASPYWVQRRLRLAGVRPINNIVDVTNYVMLEVGEPLHAFDYDILVERAGGETPTIITRTAQAGERLRTLDDVDRELDDFTVLVTDTSGPLSIAGVMGGEESEVGAGTRNVLLEGAAWNFINIRRTLASQRVSSEAAYRFSRGVHPAMAERGVRRGLEMMRQLAGGDVAEGLIDEYPLPPDPPQVQFQVEDMDRWLGMDLSAAEAREILERLQFEVSENGDTITAVAPDHRLDIGEGLIGVADVMEEISRVYGYDRIPIRLFEEEIPDQPGDEALELEERVRDLLVQLGLQEVVTYRLTTPEREAESRAPGTEPDERRYVRLANPISSEREVMRHSLLASVLEIVERNARVRGRVAIFEIGPVYLPVEGEKLPEERLRLVIALHGRRGEPTWIDAEPGDLGFFDLKGVVERLFQALRIEGIRYEPSEHASFHAGKCAGVKLGETEVGAFGELHPLVAERYDVGDAPVVAGTFDMRAILREVPRRFSLEPVPAYPPVLEDLAIVLDEDTAAAEVEQVMAEAGGALLEDVRLFDYYRGEQIGEGKKSLAYSLVYQAPDRTLTDEEVAAVRERIVAALAEELGARLRS